MCSCIHRRAGNYSGFFVFVLFKTNNVTGGDPKALRAVQDILKTYQREMDAMKPMTPEKIIDPNDPEKTLQNVTDYLYQNLGNQIVKIPVRVLPAHPTLKSMAEKPVRRLNPVFDGLFPVSPLYY